MAIVEHPRYHGSLSRLVNWLDYLSSREKRKFVGVSLAVALAGIGAVAVAKNPSLVEDALDAVRGKLSSLNIPPSGQPIIMTLNTTTSEALAIAARVEAEKKGIELVAPLAFFDNISLSGIVIDSDGRILAVSEPPFYQSNKLDEKVKLSSIRFEGVDGKPALATFVSIEVTANGGETETVPVITQEGIKLGESGEVIPGRNNFRAVYDPNLYALFVTNAEGKLLRVKTFGSKENPNSNKVMVIWETQAGNAKKPDSPTENFVYIQNGKVMNGPQDRLQNVDSVRVGL